MAVIEELVVQNAELAMYFIRQLSKDLGISDARTVNLTQKAYPWTPCRIALVPERYVRIGGRPVYAEYLSFA